MAWDSDAYNLKRREERASLRAAGVGTSELEKKWNRESGARYRAKPENKEKIFKRGKSWKVRNWDKVLKSSRDSYHKNKDKCNFRRKRWMANNPDKVRAAYRRKWAKRYDAPGSHTAEQWRFRLSFYGWQCAYCGADLKDAPLHCDHVKPLSKGGSNFASNIVPACPPCNIKKRAEFWTPMIPLPADYLPA